MISKFITKDKHTKNIQINTFLIAFFRGGAIICSFLLVPLSLEYLDKKYYGVWLTLISVIAWLSFMDVGLGNGLRNKLTEAVELKNKILAKEYVSTAYIIFAALMVSVMIVFVLINPFINWALILKTDLSYHNLLLLTFIIITGFCLRLVLDLAGIIVIALHSPFKKAIIDFFLNLITLILVYALTFSQSKSLINFGIIVSFVPVITLAFFNYYIFRKQSSYNFLKPSWSSFNKIHLKSLFSLGLKFFIIQIAGIIVFSTDNLIITQFFTSADVTDFNISYKYFSVITVLFSIVLMPYWSSFTSAYLGGRSEWIKKSFKSLIYLWIVQILLCISFVFLAKYLYSLWLGNEIKSSYHLNMFMAIYVIIINWNSIFVYFLNGISKIKIQLYSSLLIAFINLPISYLFIKYSSYGIISVIIGNCISLLICSIWAPIQCYKIIKGRANGLWNK
jgi:O-antigen/teichoic acid export membrane protein